MVIICILLAILSINVGAERPICTQITYIKELKQFEKGSNLSNVQKIINSTSNLIIFGPPQVKDIILKWRSSQKTVFISKNDRDFAHQWFFPYVQGLKGDINKGQEDRLMAIVKIFLMAQALKDDKFESQFYIWVDAEDHSQNSSEPLLRETVLEYFYKLVQPRWIFFTNHYSQLELQSSASEGEQKYIDRKLMMHEQVNPSFMGGSVEILKDIKNAYESFLRVLIEENVNNFERNALSLMPIRFPSLIPNTVSITLKDIKSKIFTYNDFYRLSKQDRLFNGSFSQDGHLSIRSNNFQTSIKYTSIADNQDKNSMKTPQQYFNQAKANINHILDLNAQFSEFSNKKKSYYNKMLYLECIILLIIVWGIVALRMRKKEMVKDIEKLILQKKPKDVFYMKLSDHAQQ